MDLKEIVEINKTFSESRGWFFHKSNNNKEFLEKIQYNSIALAGEVGEFANLVKKSVRSNLSNGEFPNDEMLKRMREEITDVFIYLLLTASLLDVNLEKEFLASIKKNEKRFPPQKK